MNGSKTHAAFICLSIWILFFQSLKAGKQDPVSVRSATKNDLPAVLTFYRTASPLANKENADYWVEQELDSDRSLFADCVTQASSKILSIAYHEETKSVIGLVMFHEDDLTLEIDLLLIDPQHEKETIATKLIEQACRTCSGIKMCRVSLFREGSAQTLNFYKQLGFQASENASDKVNSYGIFLGDMLAGLDRNLRLCRKPWV